MVTEALLEVMRSVVSALLGSLPEIPVPGWLASASAVGTQIGGYGSGLGVWVPADLILTVGLTLIAAWAIGFGIKIARIVASYLTLGGGSAG